MSVNYVIIYYVPYYILCYRNLARKACNANSDDKIVFTTNPNKIIKRLLSLESSTIVFMGVNQDNVSYKLWAQGGAELVIIPENKQNGDLDLNYLEEQLGISFLLIDGV